MSSTLPSTGSPCGPGAIFVGVGVCSCGLSRTALAIDLSFRARPAGDAMTSRPARVLQNGLLAEQHHAVALSRVVCFHKYFEVAHRFFGGDPHFGAACNRVVEVHKLVVVG